MTTSRLTPAVRQDDTMKPLRIGIVVESTGLGVRQAIAEAARMGAAGVQVDAAGDLSLEPCHPPGSEAILFPPQDVGQG